MRIPHGEWLAVYPLARIKGYACNFACQATHFFVNGYRHLPDRSRKAGWPTATISVPIFPASAPAIAYDARDGLPATTHAAVSALAHRPRLARASRLVT